MHASSKYTPELGVTVCELIAQGKGLREIGSTIGVAASTIVLWVGDHPDFAERYLRVRDATLDLMAEDTLAIADTPEAGEISESGVNAQGSFDKTVTRDMTEHRRLQVDTRKWYLSKLAPKRYGERLALEHSGEITVKELDDTARVSKLAAILEAIRARPIDPVSVDDLL